MEKGNLSGVFWVETFILCKIDINLLVHFILERESPKPIKSNFPASTLREEMTMLVVMPV